jgi:hypothetical protein
MQILQVQQLVMSMVVMIGQTKKGDAQADTGGNRQEDKREGNGRVGVVKVQLRRCRARCVNPRWLVDVTVPQSESHGGKADSDQGAGCNNRATKCSHGFPLFV